MNRFVILMLLALAAVAGANAQGPAPAPSVHFDMLKGSWVRPDGGYTITIKSVAADGKLEAMYANPNPLPFSRAQVSRDGTALRVFLELHAGGYKGSTYELFYEPQNDRLRGMYYQAAVKQQFEVYFARK